MNMLVGVITEMVLKVGAAERQQATKSFVTDKLTELMMTGTDENNDNFISKGEFIKMLHDRRAARILHEVGVDVVGLVDFADMIFEPLPGNEHFGERELTLAEFMKAILELRGDQGAKVRDLKELKIYMNAGFTRLEQIVLNTSRLSGNAPPKEAEKPHKSIWGGWQGCTSMPREASIQTKGLQEMELMSVNSLQEQINASLRKVQINYERELARLHAENVRLVDRLIDLEAVTGNSSETVLKMTASATAPQSEILTASAQPLPDVEQPQMQSIHTGMDGFPAVPKEAMHLVPRHGLIDAAAGPHTGSREFAKQRSGNHRMSMLMQQARRSLAGNV